jgi:hypothetical protein
VSLSLSLSLSLSRTATAGSSRQHRLDPRPLSRRCSYSRVCGFLRDSQRMEESDTVTRQMKEGDIVTQRMNESDTVVTRQMKESDARAQRMKESDFMPGEGVEYTSAIRARDVSSHRRPAGRPAAFPDGRGVPRRPRARNEDGWTGAAPPTVTSPGVPARNAVGMHVNTPDRVMSAIIRG